MRIDHHGNNCETDQPFPAAEIKIIAGVRYHALYNLEGQIVHWLPDKIQPGMTNREERRDGGQSIETTS